MVSVLKTFYLDLINSYNIWFHGGLLDVKQKYRRTTIGPFWNTIIVGVFLLGLGPIYSSVFNVDLEAFFPYLSIGFVLWTFCSSCLNESCTVFQDNSGIIKETNISIICYPARLITKNFVNFMHVIIVIPIVFIFSLKTVSFTALLFIPGMIIFLIFLISSMFIISVLSSRFRDIPPFVTAFLQILFFVTPIIWDEAKLSNTSPILIFILKLNPILSLFDIIRSPILGHIPVLENYLIAIFYTVFAFIIASFLYSKFSKKIIYWI